MHVIHIASELAPIAKAGGLADVVFGLARATKKKGHSVQVILPKYEFLKIPCTPVMQDLWSYDGADQIRNTVWSAVVQDIPVLLLDPHHPGQFFNRPMIYGYPDDVDRFIYFSRLSLEFLFKSQNRPDVVHLHDWPTSLVAPLYKEMYIPLGMRTKTVLTIHNLQHQGVCSSQNISRSGLNLEKLISKMQHTSPQYFNLLKGGITYSDFITTVSPTYEKEIQTVEGGCGLHSLLSESQQKLQGILNGIDTDYWNPATDPFLKTHYDQKTFKSGKSANRMALRKRCGLKNSKGPLLCSIGRLVSQKSPELIHYAVEKNLSQGGQSIVLGTTPHPDVRAAFEKLSQNENVFVHFEYDESLAHLTYAASDLMIIPSLFEPCGLTQMIALRYGCVPVVRKTGGLSDTIFDIDTSQKPANERNGFTFDFPDRAGVDWALDRAFKLYQNPSDWSRLVKQGMECNFGWDQSAEAYFNIYVREKAFRI